MNFRVFGLPLASFSPLFELDDQHLAAAGGVRRIVDASPGFPCRVSLRDAQLGETVLLVNFEHLAVASPYRSRHAIYVRENASEYQPSVNEIPDVLQRRLLSVRVFDQAGMMIDADVVAGVNVARTIRRHLGLPNSAYLHLHNAKPGCFAARVERA